MLNAFDNMWNSPLRNFNQSELRTIRENFIAVISLSPHSPTVFLIISQRAQCMNKKVFLLSGHKVRKNLPWTSLTWTFPSLCTCQQPAVLQDLGTAWVWRCLGLLRPPGSLAVMSGCNTKHFKSSADCLAVSANAVVSFCSCSTTSSCTVMGRYDTAEEHCPRHVCSLCPALHSPSPPTPRCPLK